MGVSEKGAPEILQYQDEAVDGLLELIKQQEIDASEQANESTTNQFLFNVYQMEINRLKYMLSAYLRTRLFKIEKHVLHILKHPDLQSRLSLSEITYAKQYLQTLEQHMTASCLS